MDLATIENTHYISLLIVNGYNNFKKHLIYSIDTSGNM